MANEAKTPGEVAYITYHSALASHGPTTWRPGMMDDSKAAWEAAAQAVRKQVGEELQAVEGKPMSIIAQAVIDMGRVHDIRKVVQVWQEKYEKTWTTEHPQDAVTALCEIDKILDG